MVGRVLGSSLVFRKVPQADGKSSNQSYLLEDFHIFQASPECSFTGQGRVASMPVQWWVTGAAAGLSGNLCSHGRSSQEHLFMAVNLRRRGSKALG